MSCPHLYVCVLAPVANIPAGLRALCRAAVTRRGSCCTLSVDLQCVVTNPAGLGARGCQQRAAPALFLVAEEFPTRVLTSRGAGRWQGPRASRGDGDTRCCPCAASLCARLPR